MRKKIILTTTVSFVLLLAVIIAGLNAIFSVSRVRGNFYTISAEGEADAHELQEELDSFVNSSTVFLNLNKVRAVVEKYPCFRLEEVKKRYPDSVELSVSERKETFACLMPNGKYSIIDEDGVYLYEKSANVNRADGAENILLSGFDFSFDGGVMKGDYAEELSVIFGEFRAVLSEVRANVVSVELTSGIYDSLLIQMREGVSINFVFDQKRTGAADMARIAIGMYANELTPAQLVTGRITILDGMTEPDYTS